jgi:superfamily I DNA and/or RNA helicase
LEFIDTAGCGFSEQTNPETLSTHNREEAELLFSHFEKYLAELEYSGKIKSLKNIGIISPYSAQVSVLKDIMQNKQFADYVVSRTAVNTVDSFQGQERDVIYISLVRSNSEGNIGFLSDIRRMNVAMTRARKKLVVIGDSATITRHPFYSKFLDYVNEIGAYRSAYEFLY